MEEDLKGRVGKSPKISKSPDIIDISIGTVSMI